MKLPDYLDVAKLNALFSPAGMRKVNAFLEQLPTRLGLNILILAAVVWGGVALLVFYTSLQAKALTELKAELTKADAMKPSVPELASVPVTKEEIEKYVKVAQAQFGGLTISSDAGVINVTAPNTALYGRFREMVLQSFNAGKNWRVNVKTLCVGRECIDKGGGLQGTFTVNRFSVTPPAG